ncbi:unnamed protein product, partial [Brenthis ino]
ADARSPLYHQLAESRQKGKAGDSIPDIIRIIYRAVWSQWTHSDSVRRHTYGPASIHTHTRNPEAVEHNSERFLRRSFCAEDVKGIRTVSSELCSICSLGYSLSDLRSVRQRNCTSSEGGVGGWEEMGRSRG